MAGHARDLGSENNSGVAGFLDERAPLLFEPPPQLAPFHNPRVTSYGYSVKYVKRLVGDAADALTGPEFCRVWRRHEALQTPSKPGPFQSSVPSRLNHPLRLRSSIAFSSAGEYLNAVFAWRSMAQAKSTSQCPVSGLVQHSSAPVIRKPRSAAGTPPRFLVEQNDRLRLHDSAVGIATRSPAWRLSMPGGLLSRTSRTAVQEPLCDP